MPWDVQEILPKHLSCIHSNLPSKFKVITTKYLSSDQWIYLLLSTYLLALLFYAAEVKDNYEADLHAIRQNLAESNE